MTAGALRARAIVMLSFLACLAAAPAQEGPPLAPPLVRVSFFHDADLDGKRDSGEASLTKLGSIASCPFRREDDGSILVGATQEIQIHLFGASPDGKALQAAVMGDPPRLTMLPILSLSIARQDIEIGLADGFLTSPLEPGRMNLADYESALRDPSAWMRQCDPLFPKAWPYERNYFFYGYRIPAGPLESDPHLAFDLWALPGTPVLAAAPGTVVEGLFDWRFGIEGPYGIVYYNHLESAVKIGDRVERYQLVGWIAEGQGNHLHFELRPDPERILEAFPGRGAADVFKSPSRGEAVVLPTWFGEE